MFYTINKYKLKYLPSYSMLSVNIAINAIIIRYINYII